MKTFSERNPSDDLKQTFDIISRSLEDLRSREQTDTVVMAVEKLKVRCHHLLKAIDILSNIDL